MFDNPFERSVRIMKYRVILLFATVLSLLPFIGTASTTGLKEVSDLKSTSRGDSNVRQPLLLVFTADDCPYCEQLAEEILLPMMRSGEYDQRVEICALNLDGGLIRDFSGRRIEPWEFAQRYNISVTPTMVLLNSRGELLHKPLVGVRTLDYYEDRIAEAIDRANQRMSSTSGNNLNLNNKSQ